MPRKDVPKLELKKLLKRRKLTLKRFLEDYAITTYDQLTRTCDSLGVGAPTINDFHDVMPEPVTTPSEGVAVFNVENDAIDKPASEEVVRPKRRKKFDASTEGDV